MPACRAKGLTKPVTVGVRLLSGPFSPSGEKVGMRGRLGQKAGDLFLSAGAFHQSVPNLKAHGFRFVPHLMVPKTQDANPPAGQKDIPPFVFGALIGMAMTAAIKFHRELGSNTVGIEKVTAAGILPAEFKFAETAVAQKSPEAFLGIGGGGAQLPGKITGGGGAGAVFAVGRRTPPHPNLLPRGGEGARLGGRRMSARSRLLPLGGEGVR